MTTPTRSSGTTGSPAQGDLALLDTELAQRLLSSCQAAHLAYTAINGTPRVLPMIFQWTGQELVMGTFAGTHKIAALRANPDVAITIDTAEPLEVLLLRGRVALTDVAGVVPEYAMAKRRCDGAEAEAFLAHLEQTGVAMVRIAVRPTWAGVLDFQSRFPEQMPQELRG